MKRSKFFALAVVVALMLTGAGYAVTMTDTLTANNYVKAGTVDVKTTGTPTIKLVSVLNNHALTAVPGVTRHYNGASQETSSDEATNDFWAGVLGVQVDDKTNHNMSITPSTGNNDAVSVHVENVYDGMRLHVVIPYINWGSVPVIVDQIRSTDIQYVGGSTSGGVGVEDETAAINKIKIIGSASGDTVAGCILKSGETSNLVYDLEINNVQQGEEFNFNIVPRFQQYNMGF